MTRKDYEKIAAAINSVRVESDSPANRIMNNDVAIHTVGVNDCAHALANTLAAQNPRFDRDKFLQACGIR